MGGAEGGDAVSASEILKGGPEIKAGAGIEPGRGLVEQKHLGADQQALGDFRTALKSPGERLDNVIEAIGQVERLHGLIDTGFKFRTLQSVEGAPTAKIFQDAQLAIKAG